MTRRTYRWFRFGLFALLWVGAAALQTYVGDVGTHGAMVGAYVPGWLLGVAAIPPWAMLATAAADGLAALAAGHLPRALERGLVAANAALLVAYAFVGVAVLFYVAFASNAIG